MKGKSKGGSKKAHAAVAKTTGGKGGSGAGLGWGATGPGGPSKSKPTKKGPYHPK